MDIKDIAAIIASALSGGLIAAVAAFFLNRKKYTADIKKIEVDTEVARLNAQKLASDLRQVERSQVDQQTDIKNLHDVTNGLLDNLAVFSLAGYMYGHLQNLYNARAAGRALHYERIGDNVKRELLFLADNGYIEHTHFDALTSNDDLSSKLKLTPAGEWLVELREQREGRPLPTAVR